MPENIANQEKEALRALFFLKRYNFAVLLEPGPELLFPA
jgi:hypothetical protein